MNFKIENKNRIKKKEQTLAHDEKQLLMHSQTNLLMAMCVRP
jgi:hypothetical protein